MKKFDDAIAFELDLDIKSAVPMYEQIKNAVKLAVFTNKLVDGDKIISILELSTRCDANALTITKAYNYLEVEGFLYSRKGAGYYVHLDKEKVQKEKEEFFRGEISEFFKKIADMGYTVDDLLEELEKHTKKQKRKKNG